MTLLGVRWSDGARKRRECGGILGGDFGLFLDMLQNDKKGRKRK